LGFQGVVRKPFPNWHKLSDNLTNGQFCGLDTDQHMHNGPKTVSRLRRGGRATLGGLAVSYAPVQFLKLLLGYVLVAAAGKTMTGHRPPLMACSDNNRRTLHEGHVLSLST